jgi:glutamate/aspartate transport system substrate-binding protein
VLDVDLEERVMQAHVYAGRDAAPVGRLASLARMGRLVAAVAPLLLAIAAPAPALAQARAPGFVYPYTGTLKKINDSGVIVIGHRENSPPFAFVDAQRKPIGYSLDLCEVVVEQVAQELGRDIRVEYRPVTPENRFDLVQNGSIDLECGSTTNNAERRKVVAFSPTMFVTGTKLLVKRGSNIRSLRDLNGKTVVLTRGTVHEVTVPRIAQRQNVPVKFIFTGDHNESFQALAEGKADAFANDDVQLYGIVAERKAAADFRVVGDFLTYADYALMYRRNDSEFAEVVENAFRRLAGSREITAIYERWFEKPLPNGIRLDLPMSPHLEELFRVQGLPSD